MSLLYLDDDDPQAWEMAAGGVAAIDPLESGKIKRWYRLAASTAVSGEYETVVEMLGGSSLSQTDTDRKPAAATAANGLPVATFDSTDMWLMPLDASGTGNNGVNQWEWNTYWNFQTLTSTQYMLSVTAGTASVNKIRIFHVNPGDLNIVIFAVDNTTFRTFTTDGTALTTGQHHLRVAYDKDGTQDATSPTPLSTDKLRVWVDGFAIGMTTADTGSPGTLGALRTATGSAVIGALNDADAPTGGNRGSAGPNSFFGNALLTDAEAALLRAFEVPT